MLLLPVEMIQAQVCSECSHYLTVLPITQLKNGQILCGRTDCQQKVTPGIPSLLNTLMESCKYRCVNYLEGCRQILTSATSKTHEETCKFSPHDCLFCSYKGNWAQIILHVKKDHPANITENCKFSFKVGAESSKRFIYLDGEEICIVSVKTSIKDIAVSIKIVKSSSNFKTKQSTIKFYKHHNGVDDQDILVDYCDFKSKSNSCFVLDMEELVLCFELGTEITCEIKFDSRFGSCELSAKETELEKKSMRLKQLMLDLSKQRKSLNEQKLQQLKEKAINEVMSKCLRQLCSKIFCCDICNKYSSDDPYTCEMKHFHCKTCMEIGATKQNEECIEFEQIEGLSKIYVPCEWDGCSELILLNNYLNHRNICLQRLYKCPVNNCSVNMYSLKALEEHWHSPINLVDSEFIEIGNYGHYKMFWILNNNLHKVIVKFLKGSIMVDVESINSLQNDDKFNVMGLYGSTWYSTWNSNTKTELFGKFVFVATSLAVNRCTGYPVKIKIVKL